MNPTPIVSVITQQHVLEQIVTSAPASTTSLV